MTWPAVARVALKTALLFALCNLAFIAAGGMAVVDRLSAYNFIVPGRLRLPYGENPAEAYNLSLDSLPALLRAHTAARPKADDEFRVLLIGDSSVWGWRLTNAETLAAQLNARGLATSTGQRVQVYNLGYPIQALLKDLLILQEAIALQPADLVIWFVTLDGFPPDKQTFPPLVARNAERARALIRDYQLPLNPDDPALIEPPADLLASSIIGQRRALADWARLHLFGVPWALTGIDQAIPEAYTPVMRDLEADVTWNGITEARPLTEADLLLSALSAGVDLAKQAGAPMLIINEPMLATTGANADLRYNSWYPRWAFDSYRSVLAETCAANGWRCADLWNAAPTDQFSDSPVHLTATGTRILTDAVSALIQENLP